MSKEPTGQHSGDPSAGGSPPTNPSGNRPSSDGKDVPDLLLKLLEACAKHKRKHDRDQESKTSTEWCHNELKWFATLLPRMETTVAVRDTHCDAYQEEGSAEAREDLSLEEINNDDAAVGHLCALYRAIARGTFCPHAVNVLFAGGSSAKETNSNVDVDATDGDIARGVFPKITQLLEHVSLDPVWVALSPLKQSPTKRSQLDEATKIYQQEDNVGSTIAALLNLLKDEQLRLSAVHDLLNFSNDLSTIDESNALFDPPIPCVEGGKGARADKIRVHIFTEVARFLQKRSSGGNNGNESSLDFVVQIPSRRSLLALQAAVWAALQHFVPLVLVGDELSPSPSSSFSANAQGGSKTRLINSLMSSSRSTSLFSLRPTSHEPQYLAWSYSPFDVMIHTLLTLRTKLAIVGLFTNIAECGGLGITRGIHAPRVSSGLIHDVGALALAPTIDLAVLAVEAAKCHLLWGQSVSSERSENDHEGAGTTSQPLREMELNLTSLCSWAVSNFLALALLFPEKASVAKKDIWSHSFSHVLDCIPIMTGPFHERYSKDECLRRVVLRVIHVMLSSSKVGSTSSHQSSAYTLNTSNTIFNAASFIDHFRNRCIVRGYCSHLFELVTDRSESISGPAISIIVRLVESFSDSSLVGKDVVAPKNLAEIACLDALRALETSCISHTNKDSPLIRLAGSKRRKLESCQDDNEPIFRGASIQTVFSQLVLNALSDAQSIKKRLVEGSKRHIPISGGPEVVSLFSQSDMLLLRGVAGALSILLSLRSNLRGSGLSFRSTEKVIPCLFDCVKCVSEVLVRQKSESDKLMYVEPKLFNAILSSIVTVGLHAWRVQNGTPENLAAREALSYCAIATLPMIGYDTTIELEESESSMMIAKANTTRLCGGICCRLASMIGVIKRPYSDICLCRLIDESDECLAADCGAFTFDDILPLQCRCIFLAMVCPVASHYEPTLSSIRCILADSARIQAPLMVQTTLLGLPNLFLSLATRKDGPSAASAKYLTIMMDSFSIEEHVLQHAESDIQGIKVSAMLSLARLSRVYTAASLVALVAAGEDCGPEGDNFSNASSYLWQQLNPAISGMHTVVLSLLSLEGCFSFTALEDKHFHPTLGLLLSSTSSSSPFCVTRSDSSQQWMANHVYLQSVLALVPESMLRSSKTLEFLSDKGHYDIIDKLAKGGIKDRELATAQIPPPAWSLLMPFIGDDRSTRVSAAKVFGRTLLCNGCKVFSAFFVPESEMSSNETARKAVDKLFTEIDFHLRLCGLGQDFLFSRELDFVPSQGDDSPCISDAWIAVDVFRSLCQWSPLNTVIGDYIFQRSLLSMIRIWVASAGHVVGSENSAVDPTSHSSLASSTFDAFNEIFKCNRNHTDSPQSKDLLKQVDNIMSKILVEFFLPPTQHIIVAKRYRLLSVFIGAFLRPSSATQGLPSNAFEASSVIEVLEFVDSVYPSVFVQLIKDEDHEAIQMCAAFRMYLLSEAKKANKEENRVQKKNVNEFIIGTRRENQRSGPLSRSLVPGVQISTQKLIGNAKLLCIKADVISHVLPQLLLHPSRAPLRFFTTKVCQGELDYPDIIREIGLQVLKSLVWELGGDDPEEDKEEEMYYSSSAVKNSPKRKDVRLALTKGFLLREGMESPKVKHLLMSPSQDSTSDDTLCASTAGSWIAPNFMYLLVDVVLHRWARSSSSERDKFRVIKSLRAMLAFLPSSESTKYMPQILTAVNNAIASTVIPDKAKNDRLAKLRFIAVATLFDYVKIVASHDASQVGDNLTTIVVALFPLFCDDEFLDDNNDLARKHAVQMLEWLASGDADENLPLYFSDIPFLPITQDLAKVRNILVQKGVELDDLRLLSQEGAPRETNDDAQSKFHNRMNILSQLVVSNESKNVRKVVITHMTDLIKANRELFHNLVVNEELSSMNFLTVVHDTSVKVDSVSPDDEAKNIVTKLLIRLLSRCVDESDRDIRDAIASCLGEIGAIDPNRLGREINSSQFVAKSAGSEGCDEWRLANPPWKTQINYQLRLVTRHLVTGLKSSPTALDQHKISFAIQELLKILDAQFGGDNGSQMTPQLKEQLEEADVINIVEPFWSSTYMQVDTSAAKPPPFFGKTSSYFSWLSSFCRFLVTRSNANKNSVWGDFFHACRSAIRSRAGLGVAEFLLPLFVLDAVCFGEKKMKSDEDMIVDEFLRVLSFEDTDAGLMNLREREKAVNAVFTVMDVLRHWMENEVELVHQEKASPRGKSSKKTNHSSSDDDGETSSWPSAESVKKIERLLKRIPLSLCALAASKVGMRARALQFLEMEGRSRALLNGEDQLLKSHFLDGIDLQLTQMLLGQLDDFDTMLYVAQKNHQTDLTKRLMEEAASREMYEDWDGAFQAYEQLLDSRLNENQGQPNAAVDATKTSAQRGLLRCLLKLGRLDSVLNQAYGMSKQSAVHVGNTTQVGAELLPSATEASWRLGKWSALDSLVNALDDDDDVSALDANARYQLSFGRTMHSLHSRSNAKVISCLKDSRESIMSSLSSAARDGYSRSYPYLVQLHALREVESISSMFFGDPSKFQQSFVDAVSSDQWHDRLEFSTPDSTGSNPIMNTRLALSRMANEPTIEGLMWLDIGKVARKGGLYQVAEHSLTQATASFCMSLKRNAASDERSLSLSARESIGNVKLQVAKLKHDIGESMTAVKLIEDGIPASIFLMDEKQLKSYVSSNATAESGQALAQRILQATEWMSVDGIKSSSEIKDRYQTVLKLAPSWERAHFHYAKFLDSLLESRISSSSDDRAIAIGSIEVCQEYLLGSVQHYGMALQLGQKHVYQALPRLLAMWLEFTSIGDDTKSALLRENQELMNKCIKVFASKIPEHLFYTALPQLLSRVMHNNVETSKNVALILRSVLAKYPRQSMWSCGWLRFSKSDEKKKAGDEIFHGAQKILRKIERGKKMQNVLSSSKRLFEFFISLASFTPKGNHSAVKMKAPPQFDSAELTDFIPPIQAALSLSPGALEQTATTDIFPSFVPRMRAFNPELKIMASKAKPKKVSIFAVPANVAQRNTKLPTNGHSIAQDAGEMHFLVKQEAKGDLRKDSRVQDLNNVINRIFASRKGSSGPNSRRRRLRLQLRTFSVVCLTEDSGILEWVPNTESLRAVITETYNPQFEPNSVHRRGSRITNFGDNELKNAFMKCQEVYFKKGNLELATKKFDELILKQYLPVMYWWFVQNFSRPQSWFEARTNFTLSTAVWSAVGHLIGLGDRHSENILIDTKCGECVHVDFDCIFDKGLLLPRPEVIPFRLTPNMLDAFGPTGADGLYAGALTESMRTLRQNRDTLLSVLEPFLNDPVINFSKSKQKSKEDKDAKKKDAKNAKNSIAKIEGRLNGEYNLINPNPGKVKGNKNVPSTVDTTHITRLSVEGQVQKMIMEATSHENLVQVYVGWMPWI